MRWLRGAAMVTGLWCAGSLAGIGPAGAEVLVTINKGKQRLTVLVNGVEQHVWKVSTGLRGGPPTGTYKLERLERTWFSHKYGWSPMPHSIFFHKGYAIHGTVYVSRLGKPASHGCVRLHPTDAAALFRLVRDQGIGNTTIVVGNSEIALRQLLAPKDELAKPEASAQRRVPQAEASMPAKDAMPAVTGAAGAQPATVEFPDIEE